LTCLLLGLEAAALDERLGLGVGLPPELIGLLAREREHLLGRLLGRGQNSRDAGADARVLAPRGVVGPVSRGILVDDLARPFPLLDRCLDRVRRCLLGGSLSFPLLHAGNASTPAGGGPRCSPRGRRRGPRPSPRT